MKKILYEFYLLTLLMINMKSMDRDNSFKEESEVLKKGASETLVQTKKSLGRMKEEGGLETEFKLQFIIKIDQDVSEELVEELKKVLTEFGNKVKNKSDLESFIDYIENQNLLFTDKVKKKASKVSKEISDFSKKLKDQTVAGWKKIKENPRGAAAVVGGLATLGGAYFFREGIAQNIGKVKGLSAKGWSMAKEKGSSAWEYAREIPGKVKGKFKKG